jgi:hypothetical protein
MKVPAERALERSFFMVSTQVLAEAGFITHDQKFEWNERMMLGTGQGTMQGPL